LQEEDQSGLAGDPQQPVFVAPEGADPIAQQLREMADGMFRAASIPRNSVPSASAWLKPSSTWKKWRRIPTPWLDCAAKAEIDRNQCGLPATYLFMGIKHAS
jgi:hypothetical protein